MAISVSTNLIPITLNFDNGDSGKFYCNIGNTDFFEKFASLEDRIQEKLKSIDTSKVECDENGNPILDIDVENKSEEEVRKEYERVKTLIDVINQTNNVFMEEIDDLFGCEASSVIFKYTAPMTYSQQYDDYYITGILGDIAKEIKSKIDKNKKSAIKKHTKNKKR